MTTWTLSLVALSLALWGEPEPPGRLHYGRCGPNAHIESYPHAQLARHAYGCRSDDDGFLEGPGRGDRRRN